MMLLGQTKDVKCLWTFGKFSPPVPKTGKSFKQLVSYKFEWCFQPSWTTNAIHDEDIYNIWEHTYIYIYLYILTWMGDDPKPGWIQNYTFNLMKLPSQNGPESSQNWLLERTHRWNFDEFCRFAVPQVWDIWSWADICWDTVAKARGTWSYTMMVQISIQDMLKWISIWLPLH